MLNSSAKIHKPNFIAVKVLVKIVSSLVALGQNLKSEVDPYTRAIVKNLLKVDDLNNKETLMCLSTAVQYDELEQAKALIGRLSCTAGTASTQASSTRMMFLHLGICEVQKGKRNDITRFCDNDRAKAFSALFTANALVISELLDRASGLVLKHQTGKKIMYKNHTNKKENEVSTVSCMVCAVRALDNALLTAHKHQAELMKY